MKSPAEFDRASLAVIAASSLVLLLAAVRLACIDGLLRPVTIDGPSMAPALKGLHFDAVCPDCAFPFACDAEHLPADEQLACPNCGFVFHRPDHSKWRPAMRVVIDRWPLLWRKPRRFEVVACRAPDGQTTVKRVAWLPNEHPSIEQGDLLDDQRPIRKGTREIQKQKLPVHDDRFQPKSLDGLSRWSGDAASRGWQRRNDGYRHEGLTSSARELDWLVYRHWPGTHDRFNRTSSGPITDNDPFNQGETHRQLNPVRDISLSCRAECDGAFCLAVTSGGKRFEAEIVFGQLAQLRSGATLLRTKILAHRFPPNACQVEFGICDQQLLLVLDGQLIFREAIERGANDGSDENELAIGARKERLQISSLKVWRDIYYLNDVGLARAWKASARLRSDEYGVLGDNQPVSVDSRHWQPAGVAQSALLGIVLSPFTAPSEPSP